jgi:hypothetical protein
MQAVGKAEDLLSTVVAEVILSKVPEGAQGVGLQAVVSGATGEIVALPISPIRGIVTLNKPVGLRDP